jgi:hypothetical protein
MGAFRCGFGGLLVTVQCQRQDKQNSNEINRYLFLASKKQVNLSVYIQRWGGLPYLIGGGKRGWGGFDAVEQGERADISFSITGLEKVRWHQYEASILGAEKVFSIR